MKRIEVMETVVDYQRGRINRREFLSKSSILLGSMAAASTLLAACTATVNENPPPVVDEVATAERTATAQPTDVPTATAEPTATNEPTEEPAATAEPDPTETPEASAPGEFVGEMVTYPGPNGADLMGYMAYQMGAEPRPGVIVIQEWWGLNDHIKDVADRFAQAGFVAIAPDLYNGVVTTEPDEARKQAMALDINNAVAEIGAAAAHLQSQPFSTDKTGVTGFCMGGFLVYQSAATLDSISAAAAFYGRPLDASTAGLVTIPVQTFLGSADGITADSVQAMHDVFEANGLDHQFNLYEGAPHAFFNDTRASYRPEAAEDAWAKTLTWFEQYLV